MKVRSLSNMRVSEGGAGTALQAASPLRREGRGCSEGANDLREIGGELVAEAVPEGDGGDDDGDQDEAALDHVPAVIGEKASERGGEGRQGTLLGW